MRVICIIPIYNESSSLNLLVDKIKEFKKIENKKIDFLLINNGSTDNTDEILKLSKLNFLKLKRNKGIGYSLILGLRIAHRNRYDILIHMAGNNKMSPFDIKNILNPIIENDYDFVNGTRFLKKEDYSTNPIFRKVSIRLLSIIISIIFKKKITDATCGFRAFKIKYVYKYFKYFNKKKNYTYGYEYYSYGKILLSKTLKSCETAVGMNYPSKGKYTKIRPIIDWFSILLGYFRALIDRVKIEK